MEFKMIPKLGKCRFFYPEFSRFVERAQDVTVPVQDGVHLPYPSLIVHLKPVMIIVPAEIIAEFFVDPSPQRLLAIFTGPVHIVVLHLFCLWCQQI